MTVEVTFWGVRGSFPCATPQHMTYGGNTSCVTVETASTTVILDAGTGLFGLGKQLMKRGKTAASLLLSHTHTDHIMGFPFFAPAWQGHFDLCIRAGHLADNGGIKSVFELAMRDPVFPVKLDAMGGGTRFKDFEAGERFRVGDIDVITAPLNHPNGATGYRLEAEGHAIAYITDTEHLPGKPDKQVLKLMKGADLAIYDSTYTDEQFPSKVGWGHSTWQEGVRLARAAKAAKLAVFHHDPDHTDDVMAGIEAEVTRTWDGAVVAREGMVFRF
jgi:phosphoribosyl 1,2-cyclic phosphodiesterase